MRVKEEFHHLIDSIDDEQVLRSYYELIQNLNSNEGNQHWNNLTEEQRQELFLAYEKSFDHANLVSHEEVKKSHEKWLKNNLATQGQVTV